MSFSVTNIGIAADHSAASFTVTAASGVPVTSTILVITTDKSNAVSSSGSVTDSGGVNTYSSIVNVSLNGVQANGFGSVWYSENVTALSAGATITYTKAVSGSFACISACYIMGGAVTSVVDTAVTVSATGNGTTPSSGASGAPSAASSLLVGICCADSASFTQDTGHGWASPPNDVNNANANAIGGNQTTSSAKTYSPTLSMSGNWAAFVIGFKPLINTFFAAYSNTAAVEFFRKVEVVSY